MLNMTHIVLHADAEHRLDGKRAALEVQFIHRDFQTGKYAVLSVMHEVHKFVQSPFFTIFTKSSQRLSAR